MTYRANMTGLTLGHSAISYVIFMCQSAAYKVFDGTEPFVQLLDSDVLKSLEVKKTTTWQQLRLQSHTRNHDTINRLLRPLIRYQTGLAGIQD